MPIATAYSSLLKSFRTALLLTGSVAQAEEALARAIDAGDPDEASKDDVFRRTLQEAVSLAQDGPVQPMEDHAASTLPPDLMRVLRLPANLRRFFVLRILAGLSKSDCAELLHVSPQEVDARLCEAVRELTKLSSESLNPTMVLHPALPMGDDKNPPIRDLLHGESDRTMNHQREE